MPTTIEPMATPPAEARTPTLALVTALPAEARPIIEHYGLAPRGDGCPFRTFTSHRHDLLVVISGPGKTAASAAATHVRDVDETTACLNVGIAGHASRALGDVYLADRIVDDTSGRNWYPPLVFAPPCPTATVRTVARPCTDYPHDALYDMEAAGIFGAAARELGRELVHTIKVVSDNRDNPASALSAARVEELIGNAMPVVASVVGSLLALSDEQIARQAEPAGFAAILERAHFSTTRRRQLRRQLRRWAALAPHSDPAKWVTAHCRDDGAHIVQSLCKHLDGIAPILGGER